jgi:probable F420-dependent oxidoreductase
MHIGFALPVSGSWATPANVTMIARRAEELGYATLWTFQRLLVPGGSPPMGVYESVLDPIASLGYAAAVTDHIELGTAIVNLPFSAPVVLGKQLATVDVLSGGRLVAGLGLGWSAEEFAAAGVPVERRGARAEDYLACLRALWGPDPVAYEGEFYRVPTARVQPKPVRDPVPLLLGGTATVALERIGRLADGWISSSRADLATLSEPIETVRAAAVTAGRDPSGLRFVCRGVLLDAPRTRMLTGSLDEVRADLPRLAEQGVTELFVDLNFDPSVGAPDVDPEASMRRASAVLEVLAPES